MYHCEFTPLGKIDAWTLRDETTGYAAQILGGFGSGLNRLWIESESETLEFAEGYQTEEELRESYADRSCGALLCPFPNRLNEGKYTFEGKDYELPINFRWQKHAIHGLMSTRSLEAALTRSDESSAQLLLRYNYLGDELGFPFPFEVSVLWKLLPDRTLQCQTIVKNTGTANFPLGIGWHPYFQLHGTPIKKCTLKFPSSGRIVTDDLSLPAGTEEDFSFINGKNLAEEIGDGFIDACWELDESREELETVLSSPKTPWSLTLTQSNTAEKGLYKYLQAYTPPSGISIALEPMTTTADAFNHGNDLIVLAPEMEQEFNWSVSVGK